MNLAATKRSLLLSPSLIVTLTMALLCPAMARASEVVAANDLLREAVSKEQLGVRQDYFAWMDRLEKPHGSVTKLMVNTPQGILARTVAINDRALSPNQRRQDDERINRLLDPEKMRDKAKKQWEDQQHIERLLVALPDAFHCNYSSVQHDDHNLLLKCSPNPTFSPSSYEAKVLQGMTAEILIDRDDKRIVRIDATLFKDVTFGWGFIAKLSRGGRIEIDQSKVASKKWEIARLQLVFESRFVVVKPVHIEETETAWSYRPVPCMTVAQALEYLRSNTDAPAH